MISCFFDRIRKKESSSLSSNVRTTALAVNSKQVATVSNEKEKEHTEQHNARRTF